MAARQPDPMPHWQVVAEGYETPTESNFEEIRQVYSLSEWVSEHAAVAPKLLGKKNTRLKQPEVRLQIWPANDRHTNFQLRTIWKYCNERCWQLAPYAFNSDLRPYAEFSWVVYPTKARFSGIKTTTTTTERPAPATSVVNAIKHTQSPDNRRPGPAVAETLSTRSVNKAQPQPQAPREPITRTKGTASQAIQIPGLHLAALQEMSRDHGKAAVRSAEARLGSPFQPPSMQPPNPANTRTSKTAPASGLEFVYVPELVHPLRKTLLDDTGSLNAAAQNQSSVRTLHPQDRTQSFEAHMHHESIPQLLPNGVHSSRHNAEQTRIPYSPTPGPPSRSNRLYVQPVSDVRPPCRDGAKTPNPPNGKKAVGSLELGTPRLHSNHKHLPSTAAQELVAAQVSRAAGKQPSDPTTSSVDAQSSKVGKRFCKTCNWTHSGECTPVCTHCNKRHRGTCHICVICSKRHKGTCQHCDKCSGVHVGECHFCEPCKLRHTGQCHHCGTCRSRHVGTCRDCDKCGSRHVSECRECTDCKRWHIGRCIVCKKCGNKYKGDCIHFRSPPERQLFDGGSGEKAASSTTEPLQSRKKTVPLPDDVAKQVETPMRARQIDAATSLAPGTAASTKSIVMPNIKVEPCKHLQKSQLCVKCKCGRCHLFGRTCPKERAEARAGKRKADDPDVKVEVDDCVVKVEEPASHVELCLQPKKKKPRTRDSMGEWYDPIAVE